MPLLHTAEKIKKWKHVCTPVTRRKHMLTYWPHQHLRPSSAEKYNVPRLELLRQNVICCCRSHEPNRNRRALQQLRADHTTDGKVSTSCPCWSSTLRVFQRFGTMARRLPACLAPFAPLRTFPCFSRCGGGTKQNDFTLCHWAIPAVVRYRLDIAFWEPGGVAQWAGKPAVTQAPT